jgi:uncharacterized membrane protein
MAPHETAQRADETFAEEMMQTIREAALDVLGPAAREATRSAAKLAVRKGPELVTKHVMPGGPGGLGEQVRSKAAEALKQTGGIGGVAGMLLSKLGGKAKGGAPTGYGRGRRMPVQQLVYLSVPIRHAYLGWTEYKQWPRYMHRANQVDPRIDDRQVRLRVTEKMWGFTRPFTAEVVTQRPYERIKWTSTQGPKHTGVINFHALGPRLTLVEINLDHSPSGPVEKIARGARFDKRAVRADLHRFQAWIEMQDDEELAELEGWRGTVEDGKVVQSHEDALEAERPEEREEAPEAAGDEQAEAPVPAEATKTPAPRSRGGRARGGEDGAARRKRAAPRRSS